MRISTSDASIELTAEEGAAFLGKAEATPEMLTVTLRDRKGEIEHTYRSYRERVEHAASELSYETDRTVLIFAGDGDEPVARYHEYRGLEIDDSTNG